MIHQRSPKDSALDVVVYERDLLRHCANTVDAKRLKSEQCPSSENKAEYFLSLECFLLHFRNLLGFFINKGKQHDDLTINRSDKWSPGRKVDTKWCEDLTRRANLVNEKYRHSVDVDCYGKISKFLQHCTVLRYEQKRNWDLSGMFADFGPIVDEFIAQSAPEKPRFSKGVRVLSHSDYGTQTITSSASPVGLGEFSYHPVVFPRPKPEGGGSKS